MIMDSSEIPAGKPPSGVVPNFVNPPTNAVIIRATAITGAVLVVCFVTVRVLTNMQSPRKLGWDDLCCVVATIFVIAWTALICTIADFTRHWWDISSGLFSSDYLKVFRYETVSISLLTIIQTTFALGFFSVLTSYFAKLSLLLLYLRIFSIKKIVRYLIYFGIAFSFCSSFATFISSVWFCSPRPGALWDSKVGRKCFKLMPILTILGSFNIVLDLYIFLLPLSTVLKLQLRLRKKIGIMIVFMTGLLAVAASIVSMYYRVQMNRSSDRLWVSAYVLMALTVENDVAIICSSMPACASFIKLVSGYFASFGSRFTSLKAGYRSTTGSNSKLNDSQFIQAEGPDSKSTNYIELKDQVKLDDTPGLSQNSPTANYTAEVFSEHTPADVEAGVIKKSVSRIISYQGRAH